MSTLMVRPHRTLEPSDWADFCIEPSEAGQKEIFSSWALFILIMLLIAALFTSYMLQQKRIQAVHETVISIFAGGYILYVYNQESYDVGRHDCWVGHKAFSWYRNTRYRQLRLSILLQPPTSADHSSLGVRIASGQH
jgi:hypothetical protein